MIRIISYFVALFICIISVYCQPTTITYQGKLLDGSGNPVTNPSLEFRFAIYNSESGGTKRWPAPAFYSENINVDDGLYTVVLGTGTGDNNRFTKDHFPEGEISWLEITVNGTTLPRTQLTNVPFALKASYLSETGWSNPGDLGGTAPAAATVTSLRVNSGADQYSFPISKGSNGQILVSDANGDLAWSSSWNGGVIDIAHGGTNANNASDARDNLGLGTMAIQNSNAVNIDGGAIDGTTIGSDVASGGSFTSLSVGSSGTDYSFPAGRGNTDQIMSTDGNGVLSWYDLSDINTIWTEKNTPADYIEAKAGGIASNGASLCGSNSDTHINLGFGDAINKSVTGNDLSDPSYSTIIGGFGNTVSGDYSSALSGYLNSVTGVLSTSLSGRDNDVSGDFSSATAGRSNIVTSNYSSAISGRDNSVSGLYSGALAGYRNAVDCLYSVASGGRDNSLANDYSAALAGRSNTVSGVYSSVITGYQVSNEGNYSIATAGRNNTLTNDYGAVLAGRDNTVTGLYSSVLSGYQNNDAGNYSGIIAGRTNSITGDYSIALGGRENDLNANYNAAIAGQNNEIRGLHSGILLGENNKTNGEFSVVISGFNNTVSSDNSAILAGVNNNVSSLNSIVIGGKDNTTSGFFSGITASSFSNCSGSFTFIGGGANNNASGTYSVICGGEYNIASEEYSGVYAGFGNTASGYGSLVYGGGLNEASGEVSIIAGGDYNYAPGIYASIFGGGDNTALGYASVILGGELNVVADDWSIVAGGDENIVDGMDSGIFGGYYNYIENDYSGIMCGSGNEIYGEASAVVGGYDNTVSGDASFAFGNGLNTGSSDYRAMYFNISNPGTFTINRDADDGAPSGPFQVGVSGSNNGNGAYVTDGGVWTNGSSKLIKDRYVALDRSEILDKIADLEISGWYYKNTNEYHIWPFAEDFQEKFGTGVLDDVESNKYLAGADIAGVGLIAIQELYTLIELQNKKINALKRENEVLKTKIERMAILEAKMNELMNQVKNNNIQTVSK